jgi:hypothetical protein
MVIELQDLLPQRSQRPWRSPRRRRARSSTPRPSIRRRPARPRAALGRPAGRAAACRDRGQRSAPRGYDSLRVVRKGGRRDALAINPQTAARLRAYLEFRERAARHLRYGGRARHLRLRHCRVSARGFRARRQQGRPDLENRYCRRIPVAGRPAAQRAPRRLHQQKSVSIDKKDPAGSPPALPQHP